MFRFRVQSIRFRNQLWTIHNTKSAKVIHSWVQKMGIFAISTKVIHSLNGLKYKVTRKNIQYLNENQFQFSEIKNISPRV